MEDDEKKKRKKFYGLFIGIVLLLLIPFSVKILGSDKDAEGGGVLGGVMTVDYTVVEPWTVVREVELSGRFLATEHAQIRAERPGRITEIYFNDYTKVNRGDLLVKMFDADLQSQIRRIELQLSGLQSRFDRMKLLLPIQAVSEQESEDLAYQIASLEQELGALRVELMRTEIRAPFAGVTGLKEISIGTYLVPGQDLLSLMQVNPIKIEFNLPSRLVSVMKDTVTISVWNEIGRKWESVEVRLNEGLSLQESGNLRMRVLLHNSKGEWVAGTFGKMKMVIPPSENAMSLPTVVLVPDLRGNKVWKMVGGVPEMVYVETGFRNDSLVEILGGVHIGDTVISSGLMQLRPGSVVELIKRGQSL
jgi:membrane fusion protein (multidrug efflux system)